MFWEMMQQGGCQEVHVWMFEKRHNWRKFPLASSNAGFLTFVYLCRMYLVLMTVLNDVLEEGFDIFW